jgi:signal peptidase I
MKRSRWLHRQLELGLRLLEKEGESPDASLKNDLLLLDEHIRNGSDEAYFVAEKIEQKIKSASKRSWIFRFLELCFTLLAALAAAGIIRQMWFELYEIPTGSMRPTFKEQDRVFVSKSIFGLNIPFVTKHFAFSPDRVKRGSIVVISGDNLDLPDVDTVYFGLFPGKKRYVKRCAALPGDYVYFYGGDLFILSRDEKTVIRLKADPTLADREYLPFISSFEGRVETSLPAPFSRRRTIYVKHFNVPIGRIDVENDGSLTCRIPHNNKWIPEFSSNKELTRCFPQTIGEFWGIKNFALSRILLPEELPRDAIRLGCKDPNALAWLELKHSPTLPSAHSSGHSLIQVSTTWIPLHEEQCQRLLENLYTARLVIENGRMRRYHFEGATSSGIQTPTIIPDGIYEFFHGKAYKIGFGGLVTELDRSHPIYPTSIKDLAFWFNAGIDALPEDLSPFSSRSSPRFAYFNDHALYVMGAPIFLKGDPILDNFENQEINRQAKDYNYFAFQDAGSPATEPFNPDFFKNFGFKVPDGHYLLLGDNPVMSLDCRYFGTVPENNIQGSPILMFWPFGERWGRPLQPHLFFSIYTLMLCVITGIGIAVHHRHKAATTKRLLDKLRE